MAYKIQSNKILFKINLQFCKHLFHIQNKNTVAIKYICYAAEMQSTKLSLINNAMQSEISRVRV